jgi:hypothetical protein
MAEALVVCSHDWYNYEEVGLSWRAYMNTFFSLLIRQKYWVIALTVIAGFFALFGIPLTSTSFEFSAFMPQDANAIVGAQIEEQEFTSGTMAYVLLEGKESWRVKALKERIGQVEHVNRVSWMDDVLDIYTPEAFLSQQALEQYKKGNATVMVIEFAGEGAAPPRGTIDQIEAMLTDGEYFGGAPVVLSSLKQTLDNEQTLYLAIAGGVLILLLAVSLSSYIAPLLCILNIGIAILLNYGTNFLVRSHVSFLTVAIAAILQLAISMDFSIFLIHRFEEDLGRMGGDTGKAMLSSMRATLTAISSSAMTDCAGFIALVFMRNQIGADIGLVLCKGVVFSLLASMTFLPCMILATYPLGKKRHRVLIPSFSKLAGPLVKYRYVLLALVAAALVPTVIGSANQQYYYTTEKFMPDDTPPIVATRKVGEAFGKTDAVSVLYKKELSGSERAAIEAMAALNNIRSVQGLSDSVETGIPELFVPDTLKELFVGDKYRRLTVTLERELDNDTLFAAVEDIRETARAHLGNEVYVSGSYASAADMASTAKRDNLVVELVSIAFIFVILLAAFRSLLIPVFLVIVIKAAIYINVGIDYYFGEDMIFLTPVLVGAIQLGATVDYAILFTSRYIEFRSRISDAKEAVRQTIGAAVRPMLTSVLTFFLATLSITVVSSIKATREIAMVVGRGALISFVVIMFALPALLILFDRPLAATTNALRKLTGPRIAERRGPT